MKGIVLAGGSGTRLYPITKGVSKQLLPIYDKPMIYYPISTLMLAGIKDIMIITTKEDQPQFKRVLEDGKQFGVNFHYVVQPSPDGLAQAFLLDKDFIGDDECALALGDNIFYGEGFVEKLNDARENASNGKATIFCVPVKDPERFGIAEIDEFGNVISVEEKPAVPKSNFCITGLYFYPKGVVRLAEQVKPSARGELEITTLNDMYLKQGALQAEALHKAFHWLDTGTFKSLSEANQFIEDEQERTESIIACLEQIAYQKGWITREELLASGDKMKKNAYGQYLLDIANEEAVIGETGKTYIRR